MSDYQSNGNRAPRGNGAPAQRNVRTRPAEYARDSRGNGRPVAAPPRQRKPVKKKKHTGLIAFIILLVLLIAGGAFVYVRYPEKVDQLVTLVTRRNEPTASPTVKTYTNDGSAFAQLLSGVEQSSELQDNGGNSVTVDDLSVTPGLDSAWLNILLLGADARVTTEPARTDTMIILSINKESGNVKLSSIMRDTAVSFDGHFNTRINSAYFYGGERLAMKTVNEYFGMNIEKYVYVDFNGFATIAETLGGTNMDISEDEARQINKNVVEQYKILIEQGKMEYEAAEKEYYATELHTAGTNVHLNGMQTLGYARIRKLDSDYARAERQRKVLNVLMAGLQKATAYQLMTLYSRCQPYFRTNLSMSECIELATLVLNRSDFRAADEMRLPVPGSYKEEKRNNEAMLYDMDIELNQRDLHNFIYAVR